MIRIIKKKTDKMRRWEAFPDGWDELTPREWQHLLYLRHLLATRPGIGLQDVRRDWCRYVLLHRGYPFRHGNHTDDLNLVERLTGTLDWMWSVDDEEGCVSLDYDTTRNLMPRWKHLHGPADHGADLTFGEFRCATAAMNLYTTGHDPRDLLALAATLYRAPHGGRRTPFVQDHLPRYMKEAATMPPYLQWGIYAWLSAFCRYLTTGTFLIDGCEVSFSPLFAQGRDDTSATPAQDLGLNSILYTVAASGVFGTADDIDRTPLLRVLLKLLDDKQQADRLMQRMKQQSLKK